MDYASNNDAKTWLFLSSLFEKLSFFTVLYKELFNQQVILIVLEEYCDL